MTYPQHDDLAYLHDLAADLASDRANAANRCGRDARTALAELPAVLDAYELEEEWPAVPLLRALSRITSIIQMTDGDVGPLIDECLQRALAYLSPLRWERGTEEIRAMGRVTCPTRAVLYAGSIVRRLPLETDAETLSAYCGAISALADTHVGTLDVLHRALPTLERLRRSLGPRLRDAATHAKQRLSAAVDRRLAQALERIHRHAEERTALARSLRGRRGIVLAF